METLTTDFLGDLKKVPPEKRDIMFAALYQTLLSLLINDTEKGITFHRLYGVLQGVDVALKAEIKKSYPQPKVPENKGV